MNRSAKGRLRKVGVKLSILSSFLAQLATGVYIAERCRALIIVEQKLPGVFVSGWAFLGVEILIAFLFSEFVRSS